MPLSKQHELSRKQRAKRVQEGKGTMVPTTSICQVLVGSGKHRIEILGQKPQVNKQLLFMAACGPDA